MDLRKHLGSIFSNIWTVSLASYYSHSLIYSIIITKPIRSYESNLHNHDSLTGGIGLKIQWQFYALSDTNDKCTNLARMVALQSVHLNIGQSTCNNVVATRFISIVKTHLVYFCVLRNFDDCFKIYKRRKRIRSKIIIFDIII